MAALNFLKMGAAGFEADTQASVARIQAAQMGMQALDKEAEANRTQAVSQREAIIQRRRARYMRSRALAVAGASGGGVSDPTVENVIAGIDTEGDINFMNALYSGDLRSQALRKSAANLRSTAATMKATRYMGSASTILNAGGDFASQNPSFFSKYGGDKANQSIGTGTAYSDFARRPSDDWNA